VAHGRGDDGSVPEGGRFGTALLVADGPVPASDFAKAALNWWVGDAVALMG